jgi:hypothetical protein
MMVPRQSAITGEAPVLSRPASPLSYDLFGYGVAINVPDPAARSIVTRIFAGFDLLSPTSSAPASIYAMTYEDDATWEVTASGAVSYRSPQLMDAVIALEWVIVSEMLAARRDLFHLHAAALMSPARTDTVVIAGESGSGKTTLTLGLMARGFLPYSDDVTLITPDRGDPLPFRRAFHIDARTQSLIQSLPSPPGWDFAAAPTGYFLVPQWAVAPAPIRTVLFPKRTPGAAPRLTPLSLADAVARLLPFSVTLEHSPALALRVTARIVEQARCYALTTGDFAATLDCVIAQLRQDSLAEPA